jgi:hypothetical protein
MMPESEREIVARALAKQRHDRWPTCGAFVDALSQSLGPDQLEEDKPADWVVTSTKEAKPTASAIEEIITTVPPPNPSLERPLTTYTLWSIVKRLLGGGWH